MIELLRSVTGRILIESHRGAESLAPANSWRALEIGHQCGADGVAFLRHNYDLPAVTWDELSRVVVEGEALPKLADVLAWAREVDAKLSLDLKTGFAPEGRLTTEVLRVIEQTQTADRVMLIAWDHNELARAKDAYPGITTRALIRGRLVNLPTVIQACRADCVSLSYDLIRSGDVEEVHALGVAVTLAEMWQPDFDFVARSGVDIVSWGNPAEAKQKLCRILG